jgi:pSer/pThr/pTyr-binding forkhead associated (FHA) protein/S1-C subfamily serine protease
MRPHILIRSGARTGVVVYMDGDRLRIGRRPDLELTLDPDRDLDVSAVHAELRRGSDGWYLSDLGSRNGTFLNGTPVGRDPKRLGDRDEFRLGSRGPLLEFRSGEPRVPGVTTTVERPAVILPAAAVPAPQAGVAPPAGNAPPFAPPAETAPSEAARLRWMVGGLALLLFLAVGGFGYIALRQLAGWESERTRLEAVADSLLEAGERSLSSLEGELSELADALERSRGDLASIRGALADVRNRPPESAPTDTVEIAALQERLLEATAALELQQLAASLDFGAIQEANRRAIALVWVERPDGTVATGTAFGIEASGLLATSRHVVLGESGDLRPTRIALQFTDSRQVFPARLVAVSPEWDVAAVVVENLEGEIPTVLGLNLRADTLPSGTPVATLGFPLGGAGGISAEEGGDRTPVRPLLSAGVLRARTGMALEVQGYGEPGASGSPLFDGDGAVIGVLFGGSRETGGRILHAAPSSAVSRLLEAWQRPVQR